MKRRTIGNICIVFSLLGVVVGIYLFGTTMSILLFKLFSVDDIPAFDKANHPHLYTYLAAIIWLGISLFLTCISMYIYVIGRKLYQNTGKELLEFDSRPPVLFLRAFKTDHRNYDEGLRYAASKIGPFISLGLQDKSLPNPGSARVYSNDLRWQEEVIRLINASSLIIVIPHPTYNLIWELSMIRKLKNPLKTLIFIDKYYAREYEEFRIIAENKCHVILPEVSFDWFNLDTNGLAGYIIFDNEWRGIYKPIKNLSNILMDDDFTICSIFEDIRKKINVKKKKLKPNEHYSETITSFQLFIIALLIGAALSLLRLTLSLS